MEETIKTDKLSGLVDQAASVINMLSPSDLSDIESLQTILDQIRENINQWNEGPTQLLEQARGTTSEAADALQKMLQDQNRDTTDLIETISQAITVLQNITVEITQSDTKSESDSDDNESSSATTEPTEAFIITEEDAPLVLDFINEANEHIESVEAGLLELESQPEDKDIINDRQPLYHFYI